MTGNSILRVFAALAFLALLAPGAARAHDFETVRLPLRVSDDRTIQAQLRIPADLRPGTRLPAVMVFGGFENAAQVLDLVKPEVPLVLAGFDYPFAPPRVFEFPQSLGIASDVKRMAHDTRAGIGLLARALRERPEVDPGRILIIGASFGAPFALAAAAEFPDEITGVAIVHGFGQVPETAYARLMRLWQPKVGFLAAVPAWLLSRLGWAYLSFPWPEHAARALEARQKILMVTAAQDSFIPRDSSDSLWRAIEESEAIRERIVMPGDHLQPGSRELIGKILKLVQEWAGRSGLLAP